MTQSLRVRGFPRYRWTGLATALAILVAWGLHLWWTLTRVSLGSPLVIPHVMVQTFLNVGLFITAHDAMHRSLAPDYRRVNDALGSIALFVYGGFLWSRLREGHFAHHAHPVTPEDPDYAPSASERFVEWLWRFVSGYYSWKNFALMHIHVGLAWAVSGSVWKVLVFFALPAWISALQLFVFGTVKRARRQTSGAKQSLPSVVVVPYLLPFWLPPRASSSSPRTLVAIAAFTKSASQAFAEGA